MLDLPWFREDPMIPIKERLEIYRLAHEMGFTVLIRQFIELRPPGHVPGDDVYHMSPAQAKDFLENGLEFGGDTVH